MDGGRCGSASCFGYGLWVVNWFPGGSRVALLSINGNGNDSFLNEELTVGSLNVFLQSFHKLFWYKPSDGSTALFHLSRLKGILRQEKFADKDSLFFLNVFQGAVFPVKFNLGNKLPDFSLGDFTIQWPAVYKNTESGGLSKRTGDHVCRIPSSA